jgi:hypothetical protein
LRAPTGVSTIKNNAANARVIAIASGFRCAESKYIPARLLSPLNNQDDGFRSLVSSTNVATPQFVEQMGTRRSDHTRKASNFELLKKKEKRRAEKTEERKRQNKKRQKKKHSLLEILTISFVHFIDEDQLEQHFFDKHGDFSLLEYQAWDDRLSFIANVENGCF